MDELQRRVQSWHQATFPDETDQLMGLVLAEEVGEVCRAILKRTQGARGTREQWTAQLKEELGDVMVCILSLVAYEGWSIEDVVAQRFAVVEERDARTHSIPKEWR